MVNYIISEYLQKLLNLYEFKIKFLCTIPLILRI